MPISVTCPKCAVKLRVRDEAAGKVLGCPKCKTRVKVPPPQQELVDLDEIEEPEEELPPPVRRRVEPKPVKKKPAKKKRARSEGGTPRWAMIGATIFSSLWIIGLAVKLGVRAGILPDRNPRPTPVAQGMPVPGPAGAMPAPATMMPAGTPGGETQPSQVSQIPLPQFPDLGPGRPVGVRGVTMQTVSFHPPPSSPSSPGGMMKARVYLPPGQLSPGSVSCVLVAPAGTNLIIGNSLDGDDYHDETLPYAEAGMVAIMYELDGGVPNMQSASDAQLLQGYLKFRAAAAGVVNSRNALEFVLAKIPVVNPKRIFSAGHSSAGTESLLFAAHEPRLRGCIAYAPCGDVATRLSDVTRNAAAVRMFTGLREFVQWSSPQTHVAQLKCPVFLFNAKDDDNTTFQQAQDFARRVQQHNSTCTLTTAERGGHYQPMISEGIPAAIRWIQGLP